MWKPVMSTARPGDLVCVPLAEKVGNPKARLVAVEVKPWTSSPTMWASLALLGGSILDAVMEVVIPMISSEQPLDIQQAWRPLLVAALSAVIAWRRKQQNSVIGSNSA